PTYVRCCYPPLAEDDFENVRARGGPITWQRGRRFLRGSSGLVERSVKKAYLPRQGVGEAHQHSKRERYRRTNQAGEDQGLGQFLFRIWQIDFHGFASKSPP